MNRFKPREVRSVQTHMQATFCINWAMVNSLLNNYPPFETSFYAKIHSAKTCLHLKYYMTVRWIQPTLRLLPVIHKLGTLLSTLQSLVLLMCSSSKTANFHFKISITVAFPVLGISQSRIPSTHLGYSYQSPSLLQELPTTPPVRNYLSDLIATCVCRPFMWSLESSQY